MAATYYDWRNGTASTTTSFNPYHYVTATRSIEPQTFLSKLRFMFKLGDLGVEITK